jgi:hypothetical protein
VALLCLVPEELAASFRLAPASKRPQTPPEKPPAQELWTGKQLFSLLLRPNAASRVWVNLELPEREYSKSGTYMCPKDGWVSFWARVWRWWRAALVFDALRVTEQVGLGLTPTALDLLPGPLP